MNISRLPRRPHPGYGVASAFVLGLAWIVTGTPSPGRVGGTVLGQALSPCTLLAADEMKPVAGNRSVTDGVSDTRPAFGYAACRYVWGDGVGRFTLDVTVNDPARMFTGMSPDQIKQQLLASVRAGTADAIIPEIGEAAVFKPDSPVSASATAFVKGRILQVHLGGVFAQEKKDQILALLKSAAARL